MNDVTGTHREEPLRSLTVESPIGALKVIASGAGMRAILWPDDEPDRVALRHEIEDVGLDEPVLAEAAQQLTQYFVGERTVFDLPLDPAGTAFQLQAWQALRSIPFGTTVSYAEQAEQMGDRRKARAVGAANGRNPLSIVVPCHRVVGSNGSLTGFAGGTDAKRWLLHHEARVAGLTLL